jgi:hypothetical protein
MLLGQNLSRPSNFSPSPSLHEAHSRPTSCLGLLQPINVGPAIGLVAIATGSTPPRTRPPHHRVPGRRANPMSRPGGRIDPMAQGPPSSRTRLPPGVGSGEPKENFSNQRPNPIQGESISNGFK